jgi:hypothetical protein
MRASIPRADFRFSARPKNLSGCHESFNIGRDDAQPLEAWSLWWTVLCAAAALNVALWICSARALTGKNLAPEVYATRRQLLWLAAIYTLGCGFRSVLPMIDVPRYCLHDPWIARIFTGRTVATVAELAFALQWAIMLREAGALRAARAVMPLIAVAEILSWLAVLTRNNLFHAAENSLWTLTAALALAFLATRWDQVGALGKRVIVGAFVCGLGYIAFMVTVDVPMYLARWQPGQENLALAAGLGEILQRCTVLRDWAEWRADALWLTLYFTLAVWMSLALPHAPPLKK